MSYKVYKSLNYFVVHDNTTNEDVIRQVRDLVRWEKKGTLYSFYYNTPNLTTSGNSIVRLGTVFEFSDLQDITGTAWASQSVFDLYLEQWTGHICCNTTGEDALYDLKNSAGTSLKTGAIASGEISEIDIDDISFTDSDGSVSNVPAGVDIVATACGLATYSSAQLMKTGQTSTYATGDDGDLEKGRGSSFFTLLANNPFGNTNRFTDELGGTTYANNIVIDWSTFDGTTVLGYKRTATLTASGTSGAGWTNAINGCAAISIGTYTTGWRLANLNEWRNILNIEYSNPLGYAPFTSFVWTTSAHSSSSVKFAPTIYSWGVNNFGYNTIKDKNESSSCLAVRTFTVTGTTLT